jgi:hypothetical protein
MRTSETRIMDEATYETVTYNLMLQKYRRGHLGVLLIVMLDEIIVIDALFLLHHHRDLHDLSEACSARVASFENHAGTKIGIGCCDLNADEGFPHISLPSPHKAQSLASRIHGRLA